MKWIVSKEEMKEVAQSLVATYSDLAVWTFEGNLGAGKTTLIKEICAELGVTGTIQSPTYGIVNEYLTEDGENIYHFDCYRVKSYREAMEFGIEEYLYSGNRCLIEWPESVEQALPNERLKINIMHHSATNREITALKILTHA